MDLYLFNLVNQLAGKYSYLDKAAVFLADYVGWVLILFFIIIFLSAKTKKERIFIFFAIISAIFSRFSLTEIIRFFYFKPRPFTLDIGTNIVEHDATASFPSGHAAFYFALAFFIYLYNKKIGYWFIAATFLMGVARVFVGIHWPSDILGGILVAALSVWIVRYVHKKYFDR